MLSTKTGAAKLSIVAVSLLIVLKAIASVVTGSISIRADTIHSSIDLVGAIVTFIGVKISGKPADRQHPFGHGKAENISSIIVGGLVFAVGGYIGYEAIHRLITGATLSYILVGIYITAAAIIINTTIAWHLYRVAHKTDSPALEAEAGHLVSDVLSSVAVLIGLVTVQLTGFTLLDPIVALIVVLLILKVGYDILKKSIGALLDTRLPEAEEQLIHTCITEHTDQLVSYHQLRTRKAGSHRYIDLHLVMPKYISVEQAHQMCDHLEQDIKYRLRQSSVTIHVEPCNEQCDQCPIDDQEQCQQ